jgi:toxin ParE1/3/4
MQLEISRRAAADLEDIHYYGMLHYGVRSADAYLEQLFAEFELIAQFPLSKPERREIRPPIRLAPFKGHHIFYRIIEDHVVVLRVLHHSANWGGLLSPFAFAPPVTYMSRAARCVLDQISPGPY